MSLPFVDRSSSSLPLQFVGRSKWRVWLKAQSAARRGWVESLGIAGSPGDVVVLPGRDGKVFRCSACDSQHADLVGFRRNSPSKLPVGDVAVLEGETAPVSMTDVAVAVIGLGAWKFERYRATKASRARASCGPRAPTKSGRPRPSKRFARRAISSPRRSSDMGPAELAEAAQESRQDAQGQGQGDRGRRSPEAELSRRSMRWAAPRTGARA